MENDEGINPKNGEEKNFKPEESTKKSPIQENVATWKIEKKAKKDGVALGVVTTSIISFFILLTIGLIGYSRYKGEQKNYVAQMETQKQSFTAVLTARDSLINEWMITFDQIEKDLSMVKEKEHIITQTSSDIEFTKDRKQQILKDIEYINTILDSNKKKIASLTAQLKNSGGSIKGLQVKVAELEASILLRENEISDLKIALVNKDFEIGELNVRMTEQQLAIAQRDEKINSQYFDMNKVYFVSGTYKDLKAKGLVLKEGGFLGLGKKESLLENFADSSFIQADMTGMRSIEVNSKTAKLITEHPSNSYEMIRDENNMIASIEIKDPDQFWKISRYAVLEIKN